MKVGGVEPISNWPSSYFRKRLGLKLIVYVADFKLAGPKQNLAEGWRIIRGKVDVEQPGPLGHFLGCKHGQFSDTLEDGTKIQGIRYNAESFLRGCVAKYKVLHAQEAGYEPTLRHVDTPFPPEDHKESPAGKPCGTGSCVRCPHCAAMFPVWQKDGTPPSGICAGHDIKGIVERVDLPLAPKSTNRRPRLHASTART